VLDRVARAELLSQAEVDSVRSTIRRFEALIRASGPAKADLTRRLRRGEPSEAGVLTTGGRSSLTLSKLIQKHPFNPRVEATLGYNFAIAVGVSFFVQSRSFIQSQALELTYDLNS
jgi:hypothetical protein